MPKTGESYTAARAHLRKQKPTVPPPRPRRLCEARRQERRDPQGKTGCTWERWVKALDRAKAYAWSHREIAKYVNEKYKVPGWWAQTVTVGYERIKGLRAVGQRRDGSFEANKSKTFAVPLARLYGAFHDPRAGPMAPGVDLTVRTATREVDADHLAGPDVGRGGFRGQGPGKSLVAIQHGKLPDQIAATRVKEYWSERLNALKEVLA